MSSSNVSLMTPVTAPAVVIAVASLAILAGCGGSQDATHDARDARSAPGAPAHAARGATTADTHDHGAAGATGVVATCDAHGADASLCYFCDPALRDPSRLWCKEHGRYEDRCLICHPEILDASRLYCNEHGLYEDECFICHPELFETRGDESAGAPTEAVAAAVPPGGSKPAGKEPGGLYCREHDVYESECGICHPELAEHLEPGGALKIRFPSTVSADKAGVTTSNPSRESGEHVVSALGELGYNLNRLARVTPLAGGVVREVHADLGDAVDVGAALVTIASPEIASAKADFLAAAAEETAARRTFERERDLVEKNVSPESDLIDARTRLSSTAAERGAAEQHLLDLGFTRRELDAIARGERPGSAVTLRAPFAGTIVARNAVTGDVVSTGDELLRLADLGELWVTIAVPERDVAGIAPGQRVELRSGTAGLETTATVTWVASHLNASTRMAEVRATIDNPARDWKAGMFVNARIRTGVTGDGFAVPSDAVHTFGGLPFVFVDAGQGLYEVRRVALAGRSGGRSFVAAGLVADDRVVTAQSFLVKSEFQKSRLGAGCVH
jgi:cobalt-zinc-cadmium efflux system membrane fusion protein